MDVFDVVIIGSGISGLRAAQNITQEFSRWKICIVEQNAKCGGRIKTVGDNDCDRYEAGPWRVHKSHEKTLALLEKYGEKTTKFNNEKHEKHYHCDTELTEQMKIHDLKKNVKTSLSTWDITGLEYGVDEANRRGYSLGYGPEFQQGAYGSNVYRVDSTNRDTGHNDFISVDNGLSSLVESMQKELESNKSVTFLFKHKVTDLSYRKRSRSCHRFDCHNCDKYLITTKIRDREVKDKDGKVIEAPFIEKKIRGKVVIVAVPPRCTKDWPSSSAQFELIRSQVKSLPLIHVYAKGEERIQMRKDDTEKKASNNVHIIHDGISRQIISPAAAATSLRRARIMNPCHRWIQIAYTGGEAAEALQRLRLIDLGVLRDVIHTDHIKAGVDEDFLQRQPWVQSDRNNLDLVLKPSYYANAVHMWRPTFKFDAKVASQLAVTAVNPSKLPGLTMIGEAVSLKQGWIEGALETADMATEFIRKFKKSRHAAIEQFSRLPQGGVIGSRYLIYNNWLIDVHEWMHVHPGSRQAIEKYLVNEKIMDITNVFRHIDHSENAFSILASLRRGYKMRKSYYLFPF